MKTVYQNSNEIGEELWKISNSYLPFVANLILTKWICSFTDNLNENKTNFEIYSTLIKHMNYEEFYNILIQECVEIFLKML